MQNIVYMADLLVILCEVEAHDGVLSLRHVPDLLHGPAHVSARVEALARVDA